MQGTPPFLRIAGRGADLPGLGRALPVSEGRRIGGTRLPALRNAGAALASPLRAAFPADGGGPAAGGVAFLRAVRLPAGCRAVG